MVFNQGPIGSFRKQRVYVLVLHSIRRPIKSDVVPVTHAREELDTQQMRQCKYGLALTLGIGMQRVRLIHGFIF